MNKEELKADSSHNVTEREMSVEQAHTNLLKRVDALTLLLNNYKEDSSKALGVDATNSPQILERSDSSHDSGPPIHSGNHEESLPSNWQTQKSGPAGNSGQRSSSKAASSNNTLKLGTMKVTNTATFCAKSNGDQNMKRTSGTRPSIPSANTSSTQSPSAISPTREERDFGGGTHNVPSMSPGSPNGEGHINNKGSSMEYLHSLNKESGSGTDTALTESMPEHPNKRKNLNNTSSPSDVSSLVHRDDSNSMGTVNPPILIQNVNNRPLPDDKFSDVIHGEKGKSSDRDFDHGLTNIEMVVVPNKGKKTRLNAEMTEARPENLDTSNVKSADYYFNLVNYQCDENGGDVSKKPTDTKRQRSFPSNSRLLSVMHTKEKPNPKLFLFKFHASVSQSTIDGRSTTTSACAIICMYFAQKFIKHPTIFPTEGPIKTLPEKVFRQVERAIREGNEAHELNYKGETVNLSPEEVILLTSHLGIEHADETDIDTRDLDTLVPTVMNLKGNQSIMLIKNCRAVSLVPCNENEGLLLFDSHPHFVITATVRKVYGAYLFYAQKEVQVIKDLIMFYDRFCDSTPFFGKMVVFNM